MITQRHLLGISSLVLLAASFLVACLTLIFKSFWAGLIYSMAGIIVTCLIPRFFCAKCSTKNDCAHLIPGRAACRLEKKPAPYSSKEIGVVVLWGMILLVLPHVWLLSSLLLLMIFWVFLAAGLYLILGHLCCECQNRFCPVNSMKGEK